MPAEAGIQSKFARRRLGAPGPRPSLGRRYENLHPRRGIRGNDGAEMASGM